MSKKQEFIKYVNELIIAAPTIQPSEDAELYWSAFCGLDENGEKPMFTDNGKLILKFLQNHQVLSELLHFPKVNNLYWK